MVRHSQPMNNMTVGILGGTFDPPHRGHLALAKAALDSGYVHSVLLIPAHIPPHKHRPNISSPAHRLAMTRLLAEEDDRIGVSDIELDRKGPSFTITTVKALLKADPSVRYHLIIGADMALEFGTWREAVALARLAPPLVAERPGSPLPEDLSAAPPDGLSSELCEILQAHRILLDPVRISSTMIRDRAPRAEDISGHLTQSVYAYIKKHGLYQAS